MSQRKLSQLQGHDRSVRLFGISSNTLATVKLYLSSYRKALRAIDPEHPALRARKHRSLQRLSYLALTPEETRSINAAYQTQIHKDQSDLFPLDAKEFIATAKELLRSAPPRPG